MDGPMTVDWVTGGVTWRNYSETESRVTHFENGGIVWYDHQDKIAREGWQEELEPYEGFMEGWPFDEPRKCN